VFFGERSFEIQRIRSLGRFCIPWFIVSKEIIVIARNLPIKEALPVHTVQQAVRPPLRRYQRPRELSEYNMIIEPLLQLLIQIRTSRIGN